MNKMSLETLGSGNLSNIAMSLFMYTYLTRLTGPDFRGWRYDHTQLV